jgi:hypothetical protein
LNILFAVLTTTTSGWDKEQPLYCKNVTLTATVHCCCSRKMTEFFEDPGNVGKNTSCADCVLVWTAQNWRLTAGIKVPQGTLEVTCKRV